MEDEDGTCLLDVLCDPQALNDFLHGTNELPSGDLLINSSSGEPSLFTDTPSPASLLADDASSQDTPVSGCVDLSFLEEALLASPASSLRSGGPEEAQDPDIHLVEHQKESDEICDILQQSLQEADITEDTLAGLAQTAETLQLGLSDASLPFPATTYFSKPSTMPGSISLPKDTQTAVEPPQPSLLAVGPGCPSLKPPGAQLMSLLPGNVFPTPPLETSFSINSAQSTSMITQKTLPSLTSCQMLTSSIRTITPSVVMLQKTPLPIQPKLPVNIQPRLVQISPRPSGQKPLSGFAFISATTTQSVLLSPSVGSKQSSQAQSTPSVSKPVSFNVVGQGSPIVIQSQDPFQGQRQFFLPSQTPTTMTQSTSISRCLLSTPTNQVSSKPNVDSSQILTIQPRQINFSPIFTSPNGQLTLKQGTLQSGSLPIRPTPPTVFQMPAHLAGTYAPQVQGQHDAAGQNQIRLINNASMLLPDMTTAPIVNGQSVMESLLPSQRTLVGGPEGKVSLTQNAVLLLPEKTTEDEEKLNEPLHDSRLLPQASVEAPISEVDCQPSPASSSLLQSPPDVSRTPEPVLSLAPQLITQTEEQQLTEGEQNPLHRNQASMHLPQQHYPLKPSATQEILAATLLVQMDNSISTATGETEDSLIPLTASESFSASKEIPLPASHGSERSDRLLQSPTGQCSIKSTSSMPPTSDELGSSVSIAPGAESKCQEGPVKKLTVPYARNRCGTISLDQHDLQAMVHLHSRDKETYSALQKKVKTQTEHSPKEEKLAKKQHMEGFSQKLLPKEQIRAEFPKCLLDALQQVKQQLFLDHSAVLSPNTSAQLFSVEDAVRHLLPYHTCARAAPSQADLIAGSTPLKKLEFVDKQFECFSVVLLKRFKDMLNKYRQLLLAESQQENPSAEMVMLERLFLQSERLALGEDRRRARRDQAESLLMSRPKSVQHSQEPAVLSGRPASPPSWTLQSDRPPGLKTYRSSSRGALRLTIKQESGSRKVIHNSACDVSPAISGCKRNYSGQLSKAGAMQGKEESLKPNVQENKAELNKQKLQPDMETIRTGNESQKHADCVSVSRVQGVLPEACAPVLKRHRRVASAAEPALGEDGELSEHLQSAIDSILELQRSSAGLQLDQAVSSMLGGQL